MLGLCDGLQPFPRRVVRPIRSTVLAAAERRTRLVLHDVDGEPKCVRARRLLWVRRGVPQTSTKMSHGEAIDGSILEERECLEEKVKAGSSWS